MRIHILFFILPPGQYFKNDGSFKDHINFILQVNHNVKQLNYS